MKANLSKLQTYPMRESNICLLLIDNLQDSADEIVRWLLSKDWRVVRPNDFGSIAIDYNLSENDAILNVEGNKFKWSEIDSIFYNIQTLPVKFSECSDVEMNRSVQINLRNEVQALFAHLSSRFSKPVLGHSPFHNLKVNKLNSLNIARKCGLTVPETAIVCGQAELLRYKKIWGDIVTKNIDTGIYVVTPKLIIDGQKTELLADQFVMAQSQYFRPSLIQKLIEKEFEVRTFFIRGTLYSVAIFSQRNEQTKVDFRCGNFEGDIRMVPFRLPDDIKKKLIDFMEISNLSMGSIDMIYSKTSEFVFLEVNPHGQFGFLSKCGNYYLEKAIAECIIK